MPTRRLRRRGPAPTVVECAPGLRPAGQAVDARRGPAAPARTGVPPAARAARTRFPGTATVDRDGTERQRATGPSLSAGPPAGDDVELLRDTLAGLPHRTDGVAYLLGGTLGALRQGGRAVQADFARAPRRTLDHVVGADGLHSKVRQPPFGPPEQYVHHLDACLAVFGTGNAPGLTGRQVRLDDGASSCVHPTHDAGRRPPVSAGFAATPPAHDRQDVGARRTPVADRLAHLDGETPRPLEAMADAPDFAFGPMAQVRTHRWAEGRIAPYRRRRLLLRTAAGPGHQRDAGRGLRAGRRTGPPPCAGRSPGPQRGRTGPFAELDQAPALAHSGCPAARLPLAEAGHALDLDG